ncbi:MAG: Unknown protein [uncultured Aureispira sp.]|uniref:Uncharacterized protein n=1 Tax=uncultured Aureispira sp. TaxID=1331704 RepID=A0A6S6UC34_9BACT|nr:MAG: Unknown protein [uncultured Aureispira sp.]
MLGEQVMHAQATFTQLGADLDGKDADALFGQTTRLSANGQRMVVGGNVSIYNNDTTYVRAYEWDGMSWVQLGSDFKGATYRQVGQAVDISQDGNRIAIGAFRSTEVQVYEYNGIDWTPLGDPIEGYGGGSYFGYALSMGKNGNRIAIGAPEGGGNYTGYVSVYDWDGTSWVQLGNPNGIMFGIECGSKLALSENGEYLIIGVPDAGASGHGHTNTYGYVRVYQYVTAFQDWDRRGASIASGFGAFIPQDFGSAVAISDDGNVIAIGDEEADGVFLGASAGIGIVEAHEWNGTSWQIKGQVLIDSTMIRGSLGASISLSPDGNMLVTGGKSAGRTHLYTWSGSIWQSQAIITEEHLGDKAGIDCDLGISSSGQLRITIGAPSNDDNGTNAGHVRVFGACSPTSVSPNSISQNSDSLMVTAGNNATYQWIDCANNNAPVVGETNATFMPSQSGYYAVTVEEDSCSATSSCHNFILNSIVTLASSQVKLYPNPTHQDVTLDLGIKYDNVEVRLLNLSGRVLRHQTFDQLKQLEWPLGADISTGVYIISIQLEDQAPIYLKLIKQ